MTLSPYYLYTTLLWCKHLPVNISRVFYTAQRPVQSGSDPKTIIPHFPVPFPLRHSGRVQFSPSPSPSPHQSPSPLLFFRSPRPSLVFLVLKSTLPLELPTNRDSDWSFVVFSCLSPRPVSPICCSCCCLFSSFPNRKPKAAREKGKNPTRIVSGCLLKREERKGEKNNPDAVDA